VCTVWNVSGSSGGFIVGQKRKLTTCTKTVEFLALATENAKHVFDDGSVVRVDLIIKSLRSLLVVVSSRENEDKQTRMFE
jgi:hypothetical protein